MPRKSKAAQKRSESSRKGWVTRKRHERAAQRKRNAYNKTRRVKAKARRELAKEKSTKGVMWRLTILFNYSIRQRGRKRNKKSEGSPMASALRLTAWFRTKTELKKKQASLTIRAENALLTLLHENKKLFWKSQEPSIAIEDVPYVNGYIGRVEIVNEVEPEDEEDEE